METYDASYKPQKHDRRYTFTFKTSWDQHSRVQEISSKHGEVVNETLVMLLELGLEYYDLKNKNITDTPKIMVYKRLRETRTREELMKALSELKPSTDPNEFQNLCQANEILPEEIEDIPVQKKYTKRERCRSFLRVLFTDRPEGFPGKRVLEIAEAEGFGQNMVREEASFLGIKPKRQSSDDGDTSMWIPSG